MEKITNYTVLKRSNKMRGFSKHPPDVLPDSSYEAIEQLMTWVMGNNDQEVGNSKLYELSNKVNLPTGNNANTIEKRQNLNFAFRKDRLFHKFIRIKKEFDFINKNINNFKSITPREKEIIRLLANGNNNSEIADQLFISRYTVEQHRKNINRKLKIKSFPHLILYSYAFDLV